MRPVISFGYFGIKIGKNDRDIWNWDPSICRNVKNYVKQKKKKSNLGPKDSKSMVIFDISILEFDKLQSFVQN